MTINITQSTITILFYGLQIKNKHRFIKKFGENVWQSAYEGYDLITKAIDDEELLVYCFFADK